MPLAGRRRPIGKHVAEMTAAAGADFLDTHHAVAHIAQTADMSIVIRLEEARPAGAGIELRAGTEQRQTAEAAGVDPLLVIIEEDAAEGGFRTVLEKHPSLVRCQTGRDLCALVRTWGTQIELTHADSPG